MFDLAGTEVAKVDAGTAVREFKENIYRTSEGRAVPHGLLEIVEHIEEQLGPAERPHETEEEFSAAGEPANAPDVGQDNEENELAEEELSPVTSSPITAKGTSTSGFKEIGVGIMQDNDTFKNGGGITVLITLY